MQKASDESSRLRAAPGPSYRSIDQWGAQPAAASEAGVAAAAGDRVGRRYSDAEVDLYTQRVQGVRRAAMVGLFVLAMAVERYSFKLLADVMEPYRVLVLLLLLLVSIVLYAGILAVKKVLQMHVETATHQLPQKRIAIIGCLDALQLAMQFLAAPNVSPAMTLILLHAMTPISLLLSRIAYPERKYTQLHVAGALLVALSVVIGLLHAAVISTRALTCAAVYALGALPAALSNMYKESTIVSFSRPIDIHVFNSWIFSYQFFFLLLASPFLYACQGIVSSMSDYPIGSFSSNLEDGFGCLFGITPTDLDAVAYSTETVQCSPFHVVVLLSFVAGTALVIWCVNYILGVTTSVAFTRSLIVAVAVSFVVLLIYDGKQTSADDTPVHTTEIVALMCLLAGLEISGWDEEPDTQILTRFQSTP